MMLTNERYLYERGEHESALPIFQLALQIAREISSDKPAIMADVLMCLAALGLHTSTPLEVLHFSEEHLKIRQQVCDQSEGEPPMQAQHDLAMGYATMAMAYIRNDEFEKALDPGETALRMYRSFPTYKNWRTVPYFAVAHMGWALWSLGRNQDAEKLLLEAVNADRARNAGPSYG
jgi:tetratricopeptide (TPR) repeat protein